MKAKINEKQLKNIIAESIKKVLKESQNIEWFVVDDGEVYNALSRDMFDENGRYLENNNYTIEDFDIIKSFKGPNAMDMAFKYADKLNDN